uniref:Uncharacterized protein n=1 Tax=Glossina austeni TaxID=7395 RepID=A0A1A9UES5_GLOAU
MNLQPCEKQLLWSIITSSKIYENFIFNKKLLLIDDVWLRLLSDQKCFRLASSVALMLNPPAHIMLNSPHH